ncbi:MAG: hypothetical protein ACFFE2_15530 [Candidatus Thorarchaeota archaeon]
MRVVGSARGIDIHAPEDAYFSYFNSPYIGHDNGSAIDIYPRHQEWGGEIVSPVSGRVVAIRKMKMGSPRQFPTHDWDYGIGIQSEVSETEIVRIMHCEPTISEGETLKHGDIIGKAIRSRYFNYWTGPHYHVEILPLNLFRRSSKSYPLSLVYSFQRQSESPAPLLDDIEFSISSVTKDHIIGYSMNLGHADIGNLVGLPALGTDECVTGILDGGLSHYSIGGVIGASELPVGSQVYLFDTPVGTVSETKLGASLFRRGPSIEPFLDKTKIRGLSCFIYTKHYTRKQIPQLILIPEEYGQFLEIFQEGDLCKLHIRCDSNTVIAD